DRCDGYGGVSIFCHKSIRSQLKQTNINSGIEIISVRLFNCNYLESIIGIYCPQSVRTTRRDWEAIFSQFTSNTLILGDFNAQHLTWSYKTDSRGSQLFDIVNECNLISLNDGSHTRIKLVAGNLQCSSPDISFASPDIAF
ncbi:hypothetical protein F3G58_33980, partial [Pseudomonas aeruginosa]